MKTKPTTTKASVKRGKRKALLENYFANALLLAALLDSLKSRRF